MNGQNLVNAIFWWWHQSVENPFQNTLRYAITACVYAGTFLLTSGPVGVCFTAIPTTVTVLRETNPNKRSIFRQADWGVSLVNTQLLLLILWPGVEDHLAHGYSAWVPTTGSTIVLKVVLMTNINTTQTFQHSAYRITLWQLMIGKIQLTVCKHKKAVRNEKRAKTSKIDNAFMIAWHF